jgi:protein TonB
LAKPQPTYPEAAKAKGISGSVFVFVLTDIEGNVTSATISSGPPLLQDAALEAARQARFRRTKLSGVPMKIRVLLRYDFILGPDSH